MAGPVHAHAPTVHDDMDDAEDAPMLNGDGNRDRDGDGNPQQKHPRHHHNHHRPAPYRRGIAWFLCFGLCCFISLVALTGILVSGFFAEPPKPAPQNEQQQQPPSPAVSLSPPPPPPPPPVTPEAQLNLNTNFVISATPQTRHFTLNITLGPSSPDGFPSTSILINSQSPGPLIEANTGDTLVITVHNNLPSNATTIHWHGIDQHLTNPMDGVLAVTQCAIPPAGGSFTYTFSLPNQRGTFWYHSHSTLQLAHGLYGPLVIHSPDELIPPVDDDKLLLIGDLYHTDPDLLLKTYLTGEDAGTEPMPDNIVVNGRAVSNCTSHGACTAGSLFRTEPVKKDARVRLRVISHAAGLPYYFSVDSHTLEIVEVDGVEVHPVATTRVFINPGQRYSVVVVANQTAGAYRMRATAARGCFHLGKGSDGLDEVGYEGVGVMVYEGAAEGEGFAGKAWDLLAKENPLFGAEPWGRRCRDLPFERAVPVREMKAWEVGVGNSHVFTFGRETGEGVVQSFINQTNLYEPLKGDATLWRVMDALRGGGAVDTTNATAEEVFGPGQLVMVSQDPDKGAQIVINSDAMMMHPFHLHGQRFQIVGWGRGVFGEEDVETTWNLDNPLRRDTITIGGYSHVVLRIPGTNPGIWALHCHILWHAEEGMFVQIGQRLDELEKIVTGMDGAVEGGLSRRFCTAGGK